MKIDKLNNNLWKVWSQSESGKFYLVKRVGSAFMCNCEDFMYRANSTDYACKHIRAVRDVLAGRTYLHTYNDLTEPVFTVYHRFGKGAFRTTAGVTRSNITSNLRNRVPTVMLEIVKDHWQDFTRQGGELAFSGYKVKIEKS